MKHISSAIQISIIVILLMPITGFSEQKNPVLYTVALEKEFADQPSNGWDPTLYCIDLQQKKVINKVKLSDSGAPILLDSQKDVLKVVLGYGMAANGTQVDDQYVEILLIDPITMQIKETVREEGIPEKYHKETDLRHEMVKIKKEKGLMDYGLTYSQEKGKLFSLKRNPDTQQYVIDIFDMGLSKVTDSIVLLKKISDLGEIPLDNDTQLFGKNSLAVLFHGSSSLGYYAPSSVVIVDLNTKNTDYVEIGSDPAKGIVVK